MREILVIAHDAGGAEIVAAFVKARCRKQTFVVFVSGPAARIFSRERIRHGHLPETVRKIRELITAHRYASYLLAGTGGPRSVELTVLKEAKRTGMRTCVYIDSWSLYRERFGYPDPRWRRNLPDEIWTGDAAAKRLAQRYFPQRCIRLVPNQYFKEALRRFRNLRKKGGKNVLFLSASDLGGDQKSVKLLAAILSALKCRPNPPPLHIRLHPLDAPDRYRALLRTYPELSISLSYEKDIVYDIAHAHVTIGAVTTALAVSALLGVPAICVSLQKLDALFRNMFYARTTQAAVRMLSEIL